MARAGDMALIAFLQAQNCSNYPGSWRHPEAQQGYLTPQYYQHIARTLEAGRFHMAFFDDRLAMPDILGRDHAEAVRNGIRVVKMDPATILSAMGYATEKLGLGATYSTTYYEPFHVARVFATLDHMLGGRVAWNVVTSLNDSEARNMGRAEHPEHDLRYDRADEFMEIVLSLWDSWGDDAIVNDRASGLFADPSKVRRLEHDGKWFQAHGTFTVPRTPQGRPMIIQAGQSGRGRAFAAGWGELIFVSQRNIEAAQKGYREFKNAVASFGRNPDEVRICPAVYCIAGESEDEAAEKRALVESLAKPVDGLALLSEVLNFDFASKGMDESFTDEELAGIKGLQGIRDRVVQDSGKKNPTLGDFVRVSGRGTIREFTGFYGTPARIADEMTAWYESEACDGFVIAATHIPGSYEDFVRLVVPELQRRGVFRKEFAGTTLRENLGLRRASPFDWKR
ncbi:LLM class flavin-dependent oxidoreductase [Roseococcus sp. YIM B11640]|uniref:LLM class flavin-dependent oxidoreductase n=1 Tax=Roseococcus sp. YIM B11640 TaxID=3133973 RepID=UPI003C7A3843